MARRYKICWSCIGVFALLIFIIWGAISCKSTTRFDELKEIPKIDLKEQRYKLYSRKDFGYAFSYQKAVNSTPIKVPKDVSILMLDRQFREVDYFFFRKFNNWFEEVKFQNGIMPINQKENLDCDNFAMLYKSLMSIANYKSGVDHEPAVGLVIVEQRYPFAGIPAGSLHMVNLVFTSRSWYIFEPQTGEYVELQNYPNQQYIKTIII